MCAAARHAHEVECKVDGTRSRVADGMRSSAGRIGKEWDAAVASMGQVLCVCLATHANAPPSLNNQSASCRRSTVRTWQLNDRVLTHAWHAVALSLKPPCCVYV